MSLCRKVALRTMLLWLLPPSAGTLILLLTLGSNTVVFLPFFAFWNLGLVSEPPLSTEQWFALGGRALLLVGIYTAPFGTYLITKTEPKALYVMSGLLSVAQATIATLALLFIGV